MTTRRDTSERGRPDGGDTRARLLAEIPLTERKLDLGGVATAVLEGGAGPPLVVLHGVGQFAATWMRVIPAALNSALGGVGGASDNGSERTEGP